MSKWIIENDFTEDDIKLIYFDNYRDGGSILLKFQICNDTPIFICIDNRIDSDTIGTWYDKHPEFSGANLIDADIVSILYNKLKYYKNALNDIINMERYIKSEYIDRFVHIIDNSIYLTELAGYKEIIK